MGIDLSRRGLTDIPKDIPTNETLLDLRYNKLVILSRNAFSKFYKLDELLLHGNKIADIEEGAFNGLAALRTLWLSSNELATIPDLSGLGPSLDILQLNNNQFKFIDGKRFSGLYKLRHLSLTHTSARTISPLAPMLNLVYIYLGSNEISYMKSDVFKACTSLKTLAVDSNNLKYVPDFEVLKTSLMILRLERNHIYNFPDLGHFSVLRLVNLRHNFITTVPREILNLKTSGKIDLTGNPIICATELCWLTSADYPFKLTFTCPEGTPWSEVSQQVICEGKYYKKCIIWYMDMVVLRFVLLCFHLPYWTTVVIYLRISCRVVSLALGQSYDCPNGSKTTLKNMGTNDSRPQQNLSIYHELCTAFSCAQVVVYTEVYIHSDSDPMRGDGNYGQLPLTGAAVVKHHLHFFLEKRI